MNTLDLRVKRDLRSIPEGEWGWTNESSAIVNMLDNSGLQEKSVAIDVGIDPSTLSKVKVGTARPSEDHIDRMMDATGSEAWLYFWLIKRGYDPRSLRRIETNVERENRELRERIADLENERAVTIRVLREVRAT